MCVCVYGFTQPDFTAAEAWAEELKSIMVMRRAKARDVRRAEVIKDREEKSQQVMKLKFM